LDRLLDPDVQTRLQKKGWKVYKSKAKRTGHESLNFSIPRKLAWRQAQAQLPGAGKLKPFGKALEWLVKQKEWYLDLPEAIRDRLLDHVADEGRKQKLESRDPDSRWLDDGASTHSYSDSESESDDDVSDTKDIPKREHKFIFHSS
jgi:hypothetical protein